MKDLLFKNLKNSVEEGIHLIKKLQKQSFDFLDIMYDESGLYISEEEIVRRRFKKLESKLQPIFISNLEKEFATSYKFITEEPDKFLFIIELQLKKDDLKGNYLFKIYFKDEIELLLEEIE